MAPAGPKATRRIGDEQPAEGLAAHRDGLRDPEDPVHHVVAGEPLDERRRGHIRKRVADTAGHEGRGDHDGRVHDRQDRREEAERRSADDERPTEPLATHEHHRERRAGERAEPGCGRQVGRHRVVHAEHVDGDDDDEHAHGAEQHR